MYHMLSCCGATPGVVGGKGAGAGAGGAARAGGAAVAVEDEGDCQPQDWDEDEEFVEEGAVSAGYQTAHFVTRRGFFQKFLSLNHDDLFPSYFSPKELNFLFKILSSFWSFYNDTNVIFGSFS